MTNVFSNQEYLIACERVLESGVLTEGVETEFLEREFGRWLNPDDPPYVIALSSGTAALSALLIAAGVGPGYRVAVPAMTFTATALAVLHIGAVPVFVDVDETWSMCPEALRRAPDVHAILPVDLHGVPPDWDAIQEEASRRDVPIVEDACPAYGARYGTRRVGDLGWGAAFSLNQGKLLGAGEGGLAVTRSLAARELIRSLRVFGERRYPGTVYRSSQDLGYQWKLPELSAAVARVSLFYLPEQVRRAQLNGLYVEEALAGTPFRLPEIPTPREPVWTKFRVYHDLRSRREAETLLYRAGIPITVSDVQPLPDHPALIRAVGPTDESFERARGALSRTVIIGSQTDPVCKWDLRSTAERCEALRSLRTDG